MNIKKDFPILKNNPWIVYLDSTASSQKPDYVIDWIKNYLENDYSNIHRWAYSLAEKSEELYEKSKKKMAEFLWAESWREIIYTANANYAFNLIAWSLKRSGFFKKWDKVLVSIVEHHANIVPWLILKEEIWIEIDYININKDYSLDLDDLKNKLDNKVKVVSLTQVSNVTWQIFDLEEVWKIVKKWKIDWQKEENFKNFTAPFFIVDASQSFPHFKLDVKKLNADFVVFTWHKFMADSWIWWFYGKKEILEKLKPIFSWWWSIAWVKKFEYKDNNSLPEKFETWTPNMTWAVSILKALEYIEQIWWYEKVEKIEKDLLEYSIKKWKDFKKKNSIKIFWSLESKNRVWVFSFSVPYIHSIDIAEELAENNICIRAGQHCAEPFLESNNCNHTCRMSLYIYNDKDDIDKFFKYLEKAVNKLLQ